MLSRNRDRSGFTLMELIVVIAIIATLAAVIAPAIFQNLSDAKTDAAKSQIEALSLALHSYRLDNDGYPTTDQGLAALRELPQTGDAPTKWRGPYVLREVEPDPWGRPFVYVSPGVRNPTSFDLYSLGKDGKPGGTGEDADVTSWGGPVDR